MKRLNFTISYLIVYLACICIGEFQSIDDRNIASIDAKSSNIQINTFICPDANSVQFQTTFFGPFDTNTLKQSQGIKVAYFQFDIIVPHFKREVIVDIVFMRSQSPTTLTFQIDDNIRGEIYTASPITFSQLCKRSEPITYKQFEQNSYEQPFNQLYKSVVHISESYKLFITEGLMISSIQLNVSPCHPSCLTCSRADKNSCLSCSYNAKLKQGVCTCNNQDSFFSDGQCVTNCNNKNYFHQKKSTEKVCTFINQCTEWDSQNQKCQTCQNPMLAQQDLCVKSCSSGFSKVLNTKLNKFECLMNDRFKQGKSIIIFIINLFQYQSLRLYFNNLILKASIMLQAFHSNSFSGIEVESISGLSYSKFLYQFDYDSFVSKCN
ncbi:hypothetical protein ABPG72_009625, partial [Tetrahymena utriculariae]